MPIPSISNTAGSLDRQYLIEEARDGDLKAARLLGLSEIIGNRELSQVGLLPVSQSAWFLGIRKGIYPKPVKVGRRSFWKASEIRELLARICQGELQ